MPVSVIVIGSQTAQVGPSASFVTRYLYFVYPLKIYRNTVKIKFNQDNKLLIRNKLTAGISIAMLCL